MIKLTIFHPHTKNISSSKGDLLQGKLTVFKSIVWLENTPLFLPQQNEISKGKNDEDFFTPHSLHMRHLELN